MKTAALILASAFLLTASLRAADEKKNCGCACCEGKEICCCHAGHDMAEPAGHALKGVVVDVMADKGSILVRHEEIPGVMKAMTMMFRVDAAALDAVKKGDAIRARMINKNGAWWLSEVKPAAP